MSTARWAAIPAWFLCALAVSHTSSAFAVDLTVASIEITQGLQTAAGDLPLVARNATMVRATISLNGQTVPEDAVDAVLRIYSNGVEIPQSPVYSTNGPISAPPSPSSANQNDTINFLCLPPEGDNLDFVVTVNPFNTVREDSLANNSLAVRGLSFACRKMVEIAYVPVDYVPGGGLPDPLYMEPGMGDSFVRAIYRTGDLNYHRAPLPPIQVVLDINVFNSFLLNALNDYRQNQIPAAGYTQPDFIYGWLKGNPYVGNGQAAGTPSSAAFGNTDPARFQRTFAHELGHCWGQAHNSLSTNLVGWDVEEQLRVPLALGPVMPATLRDVMVAGLNTADAWVAPVTYLDAINDARAACSALDGGGSGAAGGPADDAVAVLRIAAEHDHVMRRARSVRAMEHDAVVPTPDDPRGNVRIDAFAADGTLLHSVRIDTRSCRESCAEPGHLHARTPIHANLPRAPKGVEIARVVIREATGALAGRPLAVLARSAHAPELTGFVVEAAAKGPAPDAHGAGADRLDDRIRIAWSAHDADGDELEADLLYSPDGGSAWIPLRLGDRSGAFEFDTRDVPASRGANGMFAVRVGDGMNCARGFSNRSFVGGNQPPDVHIIAPNASATVLRGATVLLHGSVWDIDDQLVPEDAVTWTSSLDGPLGSGRLLVRRNLSPGTHVITLRGVDSGGLVGEREISLTIEDRLYNNANLDGIGRVGAPDLAILMDNWGTNGLGDIDVDGTIGPLDLAALLERWGL